VDELAIFRWSPVEPAELANSQNPPTPKGCRRMCNPMSCFFFFWF